MSQNLEQKLKDLISSHAPEIEAGNLRKYIEQAEADKVRLKQLEVMLIKGDNRIAELEKLKYTSEDLERMGSNIEAREKVVIDKERNIEIETLKFQLASTKESKGEIFKLVETLMKNPRSIELINHNHTEGVPVSDQYGNTRVDSKHTHSFGTTEHKETKGTGYEE
jgi:hypothetical protein